MASHFVTLLGSLRKASYNGVIARTLPELAPAGTTISALGPIDAIPLYDADIQDQGFPDAVLAMGKAIKDADGLIIVTPEYNYSIPGGLKNALDWLSRLPDAPLAGKPVAIQTASPGAVGGARAQYHLRQVLVFFDAVVLNKPEVMIGAVAGKISAEGQITDQGTREFIARQLTALDLLAQKYKKG